MSADDEKAVVKDIVGVVSTSAAVGATAVGQPSLAAVLSVVGPLGALAIECMFQRSSKFHEGYKSMEPGATNEQIQSRLEGKKEDPQARTLVMQAYRRMLDAIDDEIAFYLGRLLWRYEADRAGPDAFFRGFAGLLTDLEARDLPALRTIMKGVVTAPKVDVMLLNGPELSPPQTGIGYFDEQRQFVRVLDETSAAPRLFHTVRTHGLGGMGRKDGRFGGIVGSHVLTLDRDTALRVLDVLGTELGA